MRKYVYLFGIVSSLIFACNDGDLEVETISFENNEVLSCTADTTATFLFKYNGKQAMILELPQGVLKNSENNTKGKVASNYKLYYRSFSENVSTNYFCANYPPANPLVQSQFEATGGSITIDTRPIVNTMTNQVERYDHQITISDLVILNAEGNKVVDSEFIFGVYQTRK